MKKLFLICLMAAGFLNPKAQDTSSQFQNNVKEIRWKIDAFSRYVMASDYDSIAFSYCTSGKIFPNNMNIISGTEKIKKYWTLKPGDKTIFHKIYPEEIVVHDSIAYDYGYYEIKGISGGKEYETVYGKYLIVWKKQNGLWKIFLDMWNRAASLQQ